MLFFNFICSLFLNRKVSICHDQMFPVLSFLSSGGQVWPADICASVPGLSEEGGVHLQHTHEQESQSSEACASSR